MKNWGKRYIRAIWALFTVFFFCGAIETFGQKTIGAQKAPEIEDAGVMSTIFSSIAAKTVPVVVSVIPTKVDTVQFRHPFNFNPSLHNSPVQQREFRRESLGSGVIISSDGLIVTNHHVLQGASEIEVQLSDRRIFKAEIIGVDSLADLGVIRIKGETGDLPVAYFGNSDSLKPGDWVLAVGNPFALTSTVTVGVVSALNRHVGSVNMYENFIQTDAAINPGNSGGALVNIRGELVGINTMIFSQTGGFIGIGFAIPVNTVKSDASDIISYGRVIRGWLGVTVQDVDPDTSEKLGLPAPAGALIAGVMKGSPADKAGLKPGDVVVSFNNRPVIGANDLSNLTAAARPGSKLPVTIIRKGKEMKLQISIVERTSKRVEQSQPG